MSDPTGPRPFNTDGDPLPWTTTNRDYSLKDLLASIPNPPDGRAMFSTTCPDCSQTIDALRELQAVVRDICVDVLVIGTPQADRYHAADDAATARLKVWDQEHA